MNTVERLILMANQIATNLATDDAPVAAVADHILGPADEAAHFCAWNRWPVSGCRCRHWSLGRRAKWRLIKAQRLSAFLCLSLIMARQR